VRQCSFLKSLILTDQNRPSLLVFLVDHIAGTIEQKQVVDLDVPYFYEMHGIHAKGNIIMCLCDHSYRWGLTVSELGPDPTMKFFTLGTEQASLQLPLRLLSIKTHVMCGIHRPRARNSSWCLRMLRSFAIRMESTFIISPSSGPQNSRHSNLSGSG